MKQLTLEFLWFVQVFRDPGDKTPTIIHNVKAVSPRQAVRRVAAEKKIIEYNMEISEEGTFPAHR